VSGETGAAAPRRSLSGYLLWAAGEIFVVVAGVLIAFGLNAWWVDSVLQAEEQTHLRALVRDFERNAALYDEVMKRAERASAASLELLQLARKQPDADAAVVQRLMNEVFQSYREKPALDAYQALVNSAGLTLIRDDTLRQALAGFADRASEPYQERFSDQFYFAFMTRYVGRLGIASQVAQDSSVPQPLGDLLRDPVFQEHLALRHALERDVASDYSDRSAEARAILEQLRAQLR
jgi:hypothetical protein